MSQDVVFQMRDGWYCVVDNYSYGPWPDRGSALAGMQTEQRRVITRQALVAGSDMKAATALRKQS